MTKCKRCGKASQYSICDECAVGRQKEILDQIRDIDQQILDNELSMKGVRKAGFAMSPRRLWGLLLTAAGVVMAFSSIGWVGLLSIFFITFGLILLLLSWTETLTVSLMYDGLVGEYKEVLRALGKQRSQLINELRRDHV